MKNKVLCVLCMFFSINAMASSVWLTVYPDHLNLLAGGLILKSNQDVKNIEQVPCATHSKAIYLVNSDAQFDRKLSIAMSAQAQGKAIRVLSYQPDTNSNACQTISAHGSVAVPYYYYWELVGN